MNPRYLYISLIIFLNACSNSSYYDISIPAKQSNRGDYGLVDLKGNLVVDFEIDQRPSIMTSNWSYFKEDGKIRFVNNKSNFFDTDFSEALHFNENHSIVKLNDGRLAIIDLDLKVVNTLDGAEKVGYLSDGMIKFLGSNGLWGYMNKYGDVVIEPIYNRASFFSENLATVGLKNFDNNKIEYGVIDKSGSQKLKVSSRYDFIGHFSDGLAVYRKDGEWGYLNRRGKEVIRSFDWKEAFPFFDGYATVKGFDNEFGLINKKGKLKINTRERIPISLYNNVYVYYDLRRYRRGFMNKRRKSKSLPEFNELVPLLSKGAWAKNGTIWYYINKKGNIINRRGTPEFQLLFHEEFSNNINYKKYPIDLNQTLESEFVNMSGFIDTFLNSDNKFLTIPSSKPFFNLDDIESLINSYKLESVQSIKLKEKLNRYNKRVDSYSLLNTNLVFNDHLALNLRFNFSKPIFSQSQNELIINQDSDLNNLRLSIRLNKKAIGKSSKLSSQIKEHLEKNGFTYSKSTRRYVNIETNVSLSISTEYRWIYINIYPNV